MEQWFSSGIITWYKQNKRDLPWRNTRDPYLIWLSEIILQQTQVTQGLAYYHKFENSFPTIIQLANASEDRVLKLWQGLGYYSRARNLHATAKQIKQQYKGVFPHEYKQILGLKGVGNYTAAAIASFAFDLPHAVVDGNVYRLLSRLFGIDVPIDTSEGKKLFAKLADDLLDKNRPALHNQAIMEFGSQYCRVSAPDCKNCPFAARCEANKQLNVSAFPVKSKKLTVRTRYFNYLVIVDSKKQLLVHKRGEGDIWQGLYEFYNIETDTAPELNELSKHKRFKALGLKQITVRWQSAWYRHQLSHQTLLARFYILSTKTAPKTTDLLVGYKKLLSLPIPRLIARFLDDGHLKEIV